MIVLNGVVNDSRVKKCASSLKNHGYDSRIYGLKKGVGGSPSSFKIDEEVEVIPRWPFREHAAPEPVKIAVKLASKAERATAAA